MKSQYYDYQGNGGTHEVMKRHNKKWVQIPIKFVT
jgi:hypothetical protein